MATVETTQRSPRRPAAARAAEARAAVSVLRAHDQLSSAAVRRRTPGRARPDDHGGRTMMPLTAVGALLVLQQHHAATTRRRGDPAAF